MILLKDYSNADDFLKDLYTHKPIGIRNLIGLMREEISRWKGEFY
jgi:hypothetical protein